MVASACVHRFATRRALLLVRYWLARYEYSISKEDGLKLTKTFKEFGRHIIDDSGKVGTVMHARTVAQASKWVYAPATLVVQCGA